MPELSGKKGRFLEDMFDPPVLKAAVREPSFTKNHFADRLIADEASAPLRTL
jgi:hypothetical protein